VCERKYLMDYIILATETLATQANIIYNSRISNKIIQTFITDKLQDLHVIWAD